MDTVKPSNAALPVYSISVAARAKMSVDEFGRYYGMLFERVPKDHVSYHIEPFT